MSKFKHLGLLRAEIIIALCSMLHEPLYNIDRHSFVSVNSVMEIIEYNDKFMQLAGEIADLFTYKFQSDSTKESYQEIQFALRRRLSDEESMEGNRSDEAFCILNRMLDVVNCTTRSNIHKDDRYAFALAVDPTVMMTGVLKEQPVPYAVSFVCGRGFTGFRCQFRDIARGGMRLVTSSDPDICAINSLSLIHI